MSSRTRVLLLPHTSIIACAYYLAPILPTAHTREHLAHCKSTIVIIACAMMSIPAGTRTSLPSRARQVERLPSRTRGLYGPTLCHRAYAIRYNRRTTVQQLCFFCILYLIKFLRSKNSFFLVLFFWEKSKLGIGGWFNWGIWLVKMETSSVVDNSSC